MPLLSLVDLIQLRARPVRQCEICLHVVAPNYCRECDEFFEAGHMAPECQLDGVVHDSHRTY